jgi:hypothetical protein
MEAVARVEVEKLALNLLSNPRSDICNGRRRVRRLLSPAYNATEKAAAAGGSRRLVPR